MNVKNEIQVYQNAVIAFSKKELINKSIETYAKLIFTLSEFENTENQDVLKLANALSDALLSSRQLCVMLDGLFVFIPIGFSESELNLDGIPYLLKSLKKNMASFIVNSTSEFKIDKNINLSIINRINYDLCKAGYLLCRKEFEATYTFTINQLSFSSQLTGMM